MEVFTMCRKCNEVEDDLIYCVNCGDEINESEICIFNEEIYCESCLYEETVVCDRCGTRILNEYDYGDDNICLCQECYHSYYVRCDSCDRIIHMDNAYYLEDDEYDESPYCSYCYEREESTVYLHDYCYKPDPIFRGNGNRYFGVELEIDGGGKDKDNAYEICEIANKDCENIYIKTDGSLSDGLEIVSHPMTLDYHINCVPWKDICKKSLELGYTSHNTSTCGLHIHINRNSFGTTAEEQDKCIARILYFFESNWNELLKFSRRTESQLDRWAKRYGYKSEPKEILDDAKKSYSGRYVSVNLANYSTIEIRMFRGTLKYNTFIAVLQMVDAVCNTAVFMSDKEVKCMFWSDFAANLDTKKYPELIRYLKERRLYVNDVVETNESEVG